MSENRLDPETMAAFLDGTLSQEERQKVVRVIADSPSDYEALVEAAAILQADAASEPRVIPIKAAKPRRAPARMWGLGLAAAAILAAVIVVPSLRGERDAESLGLIADASWLTADQPGLRDALHAVEWPQLRSERSAVERNSAAFRTGVHAVNLEAAARLGDALDVQRNAAALLSVISTVDGAAPAVAQLNDLRTRSESTDVEAAGEALRSLFNDSPWYELGLWIGQARLALAAADSGYFAPGKPAHTTLEEISVRLAAAGIDPAVADVQRLQAVLAGPAASPISELVAAVMRSAGRAD